MRGRGFGAAPSAGQACLAGCNETGDGAERLEDPLREYERPYCVAAVDRRLSVGARRPFGACRAERRHRRTTSGGCEDVGLDAEADRDQDTVAIQVVRWCPRAVAVRDGLIGGTAAYDGYRRGVLGSRRIRRGRP